jgi:N-methylhydantoinase A
MAAVRLLRAQQVESVAVSLLHSYKNPEHERRIAAIIAREAPELFVSISSQVLPEIREYERTSTTVVNAYIQPVVQRYLNGLVQGLGRRGVTSPLHVMQSNGGVVPPSAAAARPIHIIESGPAAGVVGALHVARQIGVQDAISFDMGGTTAKACIIEGGRVNHARECEVGAGLNAGHRLLRGGGYLVRSPILDIAEVGAGGGSIARVEGGTLKVGPGSAGAAPGPACYGRGGTEPTVTDANVVLGYLDPRALAGGSVPLDADAARRVIRDRIGAPLGLDLVAAAFGVHRIANAAMVRAVRAVSVERGRDPRKFALVAFGGGGPVHGAHLAQSLEMSRVIIPPVPGLFSSLGLLWSAQEHHYAHTFWRRFADTGATEVARALQTLTGEVLQELKREGPVDEIEVEPSADVRYVGQNSDIAVSLAMPGGNGLDLGALREAFEMEHEVQHGYRSPREALQFTSLRVVARRAGRGVSEWRSPGIWTGRPRAPARGQRPVYFGPAVGWIETPVVGRSDLDARLRQGPLAIEEYDSTTIVPPEARARRDEHGNILVELGRR